MGSDLDWASRVQRLEAEVAGLRRAMSSRAVIEQAKGMLAERLGGSPDDAFEHLSRLSQQSNVRLADLAASVVASAPTSPKAAETTDATGLSSAHADDYRRLATAAAASHDLDALTEALRGGGADQVRFERTATSRGALWDPGSSGTAGRSAAFPIHDGERVIGTVTFSWSQPGEFSEDERRFLAAVAHLAQRHAVRLWTPDATSITPVLDAFYVPAILLEPVRDDDGTIVDFVITHASKQVPDMSGLSRTEQIGRRLLDTYPHLRPAGVFDAYVQVLETGTSWERSSARETVVIDGAPALIRASRKAIRYGDAVLATWRREDDLIRLQRQLEQMESLGRFGWADWDVVDRHSYWSDGLYRVFGRDPARGPASLSKISSLVIQSDRDAVERMIASVRAGKHATINFHVRVGHDVRPIRLAAEPYATSEGAVLRVLAVAQDLTERQRANEKITRVQAQLADQRFQLASQREIATALRQVLYPASACHVETKAAQVYGRYAAPEADVPFRGDFCDSTLLGEGHILFAIGDSFGSGAQAGEVVARLLYPARALGSGGMSPAAILAVLNRDLHRDAAPPLASLVVGRLCPVTSTVTWAQGGHLPPIRLRGDGSSMIDRPVGPALGLMPDAAFGQERFVVEQDDMIVWMTDGMVYERAKPHADPWRELRRKLIAARSEAGIAGVLDLCQTAGGDEACILTVTGTQPAPGSGTCDFPGCGD